MIDYLSSLLQHLHLPAAFLQHSHLQIPFSSLGHLQMLSFLPQQEQMSYLLQHSHLQVLSLQHLHLQTPFSSLGHLQMASFLPQQEQSFLLVYANGFQSEDLHPDIQNANTIPNTHTINTFFILFSFNFWVKTPPWQSSSFSS